MNLRLLAILIPAALPTPAQSADFTVNTLLDVPDLLAGDGLCRAPVPGGFACSLRAAVQEANSGTVSLDRIRLPPGTYALTRNQRDEDAAFSGDLDVLGPLEIVGTGDDAIIDGEFNDRVFDVFAPSGGLVISGVDLRHGFDDVADGATYVRIADDSGARLSSVDVLRALLPVPPTLRGSAFASRGTLQLTDFDYAADLAQGGGLVLNDGRALLSGIRLAPQSTPEAFLINNRLLATIQDVVAAGVFVSNTGDLQLSMARIEGPLPAPLDAFPLLTNSAGGQLTVRASSLLSGAGAIAQTGLESGSHLELENVTASGHTTDVAVIAIDSGTALLRHVTIAGNTLVRGEFSTPAALSESGALSVAVGHSVIGDNPSIGVGDGDVEAPNCRGTFSSEGFNAIGDTIGCGGLPGAAGDFLSTPSVGLLPLDPIDGVHRPTPGSPLIDGGSAGECLDLESQALLHDALGAPRPTDGDGDGLARCDIGAVEADGVAPPDAIFANGFE